ncbi:hypothetical protein ABPG77_005330 [Micractinium sp. CCAP 211/92]
MAHAEARCGEEAYSVGINTPDQTFRITSATPITTFHWKIKHPLPAEVEQRYVQACPTQPDGTFLFAVSQQEEDWSLSFPAPAAQQKQEIVPAAQEMDEIVELAPQHVLPAEQAKEYTEFKEVLAELAGHMVRLLDATKRAVSAARKEQEKGKEVK